MQNILVIDDEKDICNVLKYYLEKIGYKVYCEYDGIKGYFSAVKNTPDLIVLDLFLPGMNGVEVFKKLKAEPKTENIPVIVLSAKNTESDKVGCFEIGAEDYVTKPFSLKELSARIKAVLKRCCKDFDKNRPITFCGIEINPSSHEVLVDGKELKLTLKEFNLLHYLVLNHDKVLTRKQILKDLWNIDVDLDTRTIDVHITRLRKKLKRTNCVISTVHGVGYKLSNK